MKPKNVMLLGFINRAVEYLDKHMDEQPDERLAELKNIDLASLRDELSDNLDNSLGTMQSTMATLLKAGNEAFDKFVEDSTGKKTIADEFERMFDVDLDSTRKNNQQELAKLLSFYNLDNDFDVDDYQEIGAPIENEKQIIPEEANNDSAILNQKDADYLQTIIDNVGSYEDNQPIVINKPKANTDELDSVFNEIVDNEPANKNNQKQYVNSLIDDLKSELEKEEEYKKQKEEKNKEAYVRIKELYPNLTDGFIRNVYDLKEQLAAEYKKDSKLVVFHRVKFNDVDRLRKFVEIVLNHGYQINADEDKMIVDIFKQFINEDGKIIKNIYEIANQASLLVGDYEGYNVILNEE